MGYDRDEWLILRDKMLEYMKNLFIVKDGQKYLPKGQSGIVTFGLKKGFEAGKKVADNTKLFSILANIGDTKSLIIHPASTTHQQLDEDAQKTTGVTADLIRLSVGLEDVNDLIADLESAFSQI